MDDNKFEYKLKAIISNKMKISLYKMMTHKFIISSYLQAKRREQ